MKELLLFNRSDYHAEDGRYPDRYELGDLVQVAYRSGQFERLTNRSFKVLTVEDMTDEQVSELLKSYEDTRDPENPVLLARRQKTIDVSRISFVDEKATVSRQADLTITDREDSQLTGR